MPRVAPLLLAALLLVVACDDDPTKKPAAPTAPSAVTTRVTGGDAAPSGRSSVCLAYKRERERVQQAIAEHPGDAQLLQRDRKFEKLVHAACH
jgi:hypothetical protein